MKNTRDFKWIKMVITVTIFSLPFFIYAQGNAGLFQELNHEVVELSTEQLLKLDHLQQNPMNRTIQLVDIGNLKTLQDKGVLPLRIPGINGVLLAHATRVEAASETEYIWNGEFQSQVGGSVTIIAKNGAIFGQINVNEKIYSLRDIGNGKNVIIEIDETRIGLNECATLEGGGISGGNATNDDKGNSEDLNAKSDCNATVRVLVLFTAAAAIVGDPENDAELFVQQTIQACRNSDINQHDLDFDLVGVEELVGFVERPNNIAGDLDALRLDIIAQNIRNQFEADLTILLTDGNYFNNRIVGIAFVDEVGDDDFGWAMSEIDAAGGRFTFAHEVAHLFGARHDTDPTPGFAHAHNYTTRKWFLGKRRWRRTILNALPAGESRIQHFSNPDVDFSGKPTGIEDERDNVRQMRSTACDVAAYLTFQAPMSVMIRGGFGNWCASVEGCDNVSSYTWAWSEDGFTYYNIGFGACLNMNSFPTNNDRIFLRLIASCADGQTATGFQTVDIDSDIIELNAPAQVILSDAIKDDVRPKVQSTTKITPFPNPSSDYVHIKLDLEESSEVSLSIVDMMGKPVNMLYQGKLEKGIHYFHELTEHYKTGFYVIRLATAHEIKTARIIIQKK